MYKVNISFLSPTSYEMFHRPFLPNSYFQFHLIFITDIYLFKWQMYPLWLCPFILYDQPGMVHPPQKGDQLYVDIGAYGSPKSSTWEAVKTTKALEAYVIKSGGYVLQILQKLGRGGGWEGGGVLCCPTYRIW